MIVGVGYFTQYVDVDLYVVLFYLWVSLLGCFLSFSSFFLFDFDPVSGTLRLSDELGGQVTC